MTNGNKTAILIKSKLVGKTTGYLKNMAKQLMADTQEGAGVVFVMVLDVIEQRMEENEFIAFCDSL